MENNKDLGKFIKSKLSQLDKTPNDNLWNKIENDLNKKNNKKPYLYYLLFFLLGGILSLLLTNLFENKPENYKKEKLKNDIKIVSDTLGLNSKSIIKTSKKNIIDSTEYLIYEECITYKILKKSNQKPIYKVEKSTDIETKKKSYLLTNNVTNQNRKSNSKNTILTENDFKINEAENKLNTIIKQNSNSTSGFTTNEVNLFSNKNDSDSIKKDSIEELIVEKNKTKTKKEKEVGETEKKQEKSKKLISIFYGPTFFNSITKGSSINKSLIETAKTTHVENSFGVYYAKAFKHNGYRVGIANTNLSYNSIISNQNNSFSLDFSNINAINEIDITRINNVYANSNSIKLRQNISYLQFPIEVYKTIYGVEKKFKINLLVGITPELLLSNSLFLYDSKNENELKLGRVSNINNFNVSSQVGLGFNYNLNQKFFIHCDPIFKYQVLPYNDYHDFTPYYITIQTGIGYNF